MIHIKLLTESDIEIVVLKFAEHNWHKPTILFKNYLKEQNQQKRKIWIAYWENNFAGYITLYLDSKYLFFKKNNIPEIQDFNILLPFRNQGIGTKLLEIAEQAASTISSNVGLGVGLYSDYGAAHKLYTKKGYILDGKGITYNYQYLKPGTKITLDDDLCLWFTKQLR